MVGRDIEKFYKPAVEHEGEAFAEIHELRTFRYPEHSISFDVRKGEILGFAGLVGAGRSEAAQAIFGVDAPVSGDISLDGQVVNISTARDAIKNGIYLIPEDRRTAGLIVEDPIRENISLPDLSSFSSSGLISVEKERDRA